MFNVRIGKLFCNQLIITSAQSIPWNTLAAVRQLSLSTVRRESINPGAHNHRTNNLEKRFLVWTGKYKTVDEVPNFVSTEVMERARNRIRIRLANIMMGLTVVGCIIMVISGKRASGRGESVTKQNLEWHRKYNEESSKTKEQ